MLHYIFFEFKKIKMKLIFKQLIIFLITNCVRPFTRPLH